MSTVNRHIWTERVGGVLTLSQPSSLAPHHVLSGCLSLLVTHSPPSLPPSPPPPPTHTQPPDQVPSDEEVRCIVHHVLLEDAIKLAQSRERYERLKELGLLF